MAIASFAPAASAFLGVATSSASVALPGSGQTTAVIANIGEKTAFVLLGNASVSASYQTAMAILPNSSVALAIGSNTYLAAVTLAGATGLNITTGT